MRAVWLGRAMLVFIVQAVVVTYGAEGAEIPQPSTSGRLIVELESPPLVKITEALSAQKSRRGVDVTSSAAVAHRQRVTQEQDAFLDRARTLFPQLAVSTFIDEGRRRRENRTSVLLNTVAVDLGGQDPKKIAAELRELAGVRAVYPDHRYAPTLYASLPLIDAPAMWSDPAIGGMSNAGAGVRIASVDGGLHHDAPMFSGAGYSYPPGYPLGDTANTNGKIIVSRAYFRAADPPVAGDGNTWPVYGTSHGVHTGSTAGGNSVTADYLGYSTTVSGVAPAAWLMSYRIFYAAQSGDGAAYSAEILAALDDVVADGADVVNNSWGGGPTSTGGAFDPIDSALVNATQAGIVVVMSNGNSGPAYGTGDHPSNAYMNVAATTTDSSLSSGRLSVSAPTPVPAGLLNMPYSSASFGEPLPGETVVEWSFVTAASVDAANAEGCTAFAAGSFTDTAVLIARGSCEFGVKVLNAETAGADFVIVYNNAAGGDSLLNMGAGAVGSQVTIPSVFVGNTNGEALKAWYDANGAASRVETDTVAFVVTGSPDRVAAFSSRGPGVGDTLKPDLAAPGVSILAHGYTPGASGEAVHLGFGQASGTSMAAPHVTGAAALLRQVHPGWTNAEIKSALMSTAKYLDVFNEDGTPAQPLDMGAGRIDLSKAADPGVILDPPSVAFGRVAAGATGSRTFSVRNITSSQETFTIATVDTSAGFGTPPAVAGLTADPTSVSLPPNGSATVTLSWDSSVAAGPGDLQGYVVLDGDRGHEAHLPVWMRVVPAAGLADVLLIDNDGSITLGNPDYTSFYTAALDQLGLSYTVLDADARVLEDPRPATYLPPAAELAGYPMIVYQTGDYYYSDGAFSVPTPPTSTDRARLTEYLNGGGKLIAFGQDLDEVVGRDSFLYGYNLGSRWIQDGLIGAPSTTAPQLLTGVTGMAMAGLAVDVSATGDGAGNQAYVNELEASGDATGENGEVTPLLEYLGGAPLAGGAVALHHRQQVSLDRPGISYLGASVAFGFGLEGVNDDTGSSTRAELLGATIDLLNDQVTASVGASREPSSPVVSFVGAMTSAGTPVSYRWDFGDGSPYQTTTSSVTTHVYAEGAYTARLELTNANGTRGLASVSFTVPELLLFSDGFESGDLSEWSATR